MERFKKIYKIHSIMLALIMLALKYWIYWIEEKCIIIIYNLVGVNPCMKYSINFILRPSLTDGISLLCLLWWIVEVVFLYLLNTYNFSNRIERK